ncbi:hypothetical protein PRZ48_006707 [Zasmidium cellare]|uniref:ABC-type glycine betaine transport system substrate-binding domain-containing protein n=1 Tax=Zasmidium cellare TaxID=395010 RepID=A0ABR0EPH7_ZASCE|nr:hypothetical protein PRZ48_006707 [Zasmidium cellare]
MTAVEGQHARLTIRQGRIDLSFHQVAGEVIAHVLQDPRLFLDSSTKPESAPTVNVEVSSAVHEDAFRALQKGETDILMGWFDGSHGKYVAPFRDEVIILGDASDSDTSPGPAVYNPYCIWAVPDYVPEAIVPDVESLADSAVVRRMTPEPSSGKYVLQGIGAGAGISNFSKEMIQEYGLEQQGYWFVIPLWHPQYLNGAHNLRALKEPKGLLRPVDDDRIVVRKAFVDSLPQGHRQSLLRVLSRVVLGNNRARFDSWFENGHVDIVERARELSRYVLPGEDIVEPHKLAIPQKNPTPTGAYKAFSVSRSGVVSTSFQLPWKLDVNLAKDSKPTLAAVGSVAKDAIQDSLTISEHEALHAIRIYALNLLAQLRDAADGDLGRIQLLRVDGFVATQQASQINVPRILDAASLLLNHALGPVQGAHARTAVIVHSNPLNVPTMLGATAELRW